MKAKLLFIMFVTIALISLNFNGHAQTIVEQWTFDGATPETGINGTTIPTWTTAEPNSVPSAGVLRYANPSTSGLVTGLPDIDGTIIDKLSVTFDVADFYIPASNAFRVKLAKIGGNLLEIKLTSWSSGQFIADILLGSTSVLKASDTGVNFTSGFPTGLGAALTMVATFDFKNDNVSFEVSGAGATNFTTTSWTGPAGTDLSAFIPLIEGFQIQTGGGVSWATWIDFETVTIEAYGLPTSTPTHEMDNDKVWYSKATNTIHIEGVKANSVSVYSLSGAKVAEYNAPGSTLTLGHIPSGLYVVSVATDAGTKVVKIKK